MRNEQNSGVLSWEPTPLCRGSSWTKGGMEVWSCLTPGTAENPFLCYRLSYSCKYSHANMWDLVVYLSMCQEAHTSFFIRWHFNSF